MRFPDARGPCHDLAVEYFALMCPHCGETVDFEFSDDDAGEMVADCPVCCRPCVLRLDRDEYGDLQVTIESDS